MALLSASKKQAGEVAGYSASIYVKVNVFFSAPSVTTNTDDPSTYLRPPCYSRERIGMYIVYVCKLGDLFPSGRAVMESQSLTFQ